MFAIAYDLDTEKLQKHYHNGSYQNAYSDIQRYLAKHGFERQQGSILYGNDTVTHTGAVIAVARLARKHKWLRKVIRDIRILRLAENDDLMPAIQYGSTCLLVLKQAILRSDFAAWAGAQRRRKPEWAAEKPGNCDLGDRDSVRPCGRLAVEVTGAGRALRLALVADGFPDATLHH